MGDFVLQLFGQLLVLVLQGHFSGLVSLVDHLDFLKLLLQLGVRSRQLVELGLVILQEGRDFSSHLSLVRLHVLFNDMKECLDILLHSQVHVLFEFLVSLQNSLIFFLDVGQSLICPGHVILLCFAGHCLKHILLLITILPQFGFQLRHIVQVFIFDLSRPDVVLHLTELGVHGLQLVSESGHLLVLSIHGLQVLFALGQGASDVLVLLDPHGHCLVL